MTESLEQLRKLGSREDVALALLWLACNTRDRGDLAGAMAPFEETIALWRELDNKGGAAIAANGLGELLYYLGETARAGAYYEEALVLARVARDGDLAALVLSNLGRVAQARGEHTRARELTEESVALLRERTFWGLFWALHELGNVLTAQGDYARAREVLSESLRLQQPIGATWLITTNLEHFARLEVRQARSERAARLYGAAEALREAIGRPMVPSDRPDYELDLTAVRELLDKGTFDAAWADGRKMTLDEAIAYALEES